MIKRDYYEVLGISRDSDTDEIKKAYRRLALEYHPDRNKEDPAAEERFKEASEAYEVLSDSHKRNLYDTYGHRGLEGSGFHGFTDINDIFSSMGDIFEEFFGGLGGFSHAGRRRDRARKGADLRQDIRISFEESYKGVDRELSFTKEIQCERCGGSRMEPGTKRIDCTVCGGSGAMTQRQGFFVMQTTCPACHGDGHRIEKFCKDCRGHGRARAKKVLAVKVPPGISDGVSILMRGEGQAGENGGPSGDLYVCVSVSSHGFFERHGDDVMCTVPISFPQAALGCKMKVPTLDGDVEIEIPEGTEPGDAIKIKGRGFEGLNRRGKRGDQIVMIRILTPKKLSKKQKKLLEEFMNSD
jgi:molecular chaperone DnaJ